MSAAAAVTAALVGMPVVADTAQSSSSSSSSITSINDLREFEALLNSKSPEEISRHLSGYRDEELVDFFAKFIIRDERVIELAVTHWCKNANPQNKNKHENALKFLERIWIYDPAFNMDDQCMYFFFHYEYAIPIKSITNRAVIAIICAILRRREMFGTWIKNSHKSSLRLSHFNYNNIIRRHIDRKQFTAHYLRQLALAHAWKAADMRAVMDAVVNKLEGPTNATQSIEPLANRRAWVDEIRAVLLERTFHPGMLSKFLHPPFPVTPTIPPSVPTESVPAKSAFTPVKRKSAGN